MNLQELNSVLTSIELKLANRQLDRVDDLQEAKGTKITTAEEFLDKIKRAIEKHMPPGQILDSGFRESLGGGGRRNMHIWTSLARSKDKVSGGIWNNDYALQKFLIWDIEKDGILKDKVTVEASGSQSLSVKPEPGSYRAFDSVKFGWRKKTGTPEQIVKHFDNYFAKVAKVIKANKDNIPGSY